MSFALHRPSTADEAVELARRLGPEARFIAGGTDLVIQMNRRQQAPDHVIDLSRLRDLDGIAETADRITIGALTTHKTIERHPAFAEVLAAFREAACVVGGHQVRNIGTIGGNIANASPAADLLPPLLVFDAELTLLGPSGERSLALETFLLGPRRTARASDEVVRSIAIARPAAGTASAYLKAGRRKAMEISVVSVAARLTLDGGTGRCCDVRIALGAVAPTAIRIRAAEQALEGAIPDEAAFRDAGRLAADAASPITDVRASSEYRRLLVDTLVPRALARCRDRIAAEAARLSERAS